MPTARRGVAMRRSGPGLIAYSSSTISCGSPRKPIEPVRESDFDLLLRVSAPRRSHDVVVIAIRGHALQGLLVRRPNAPFQSARALPGGFVEIDEGLGSTTVKPISINVKRSDAEAGTPALVGRGCLWGQVPHSCPSANFHLSIDRFRKRTGTAAPGHNRAFKVASVSYLKNAVSRHWICALQ